MVLIPVRIRNTTNRKLGIHIRVMTEHRFPIFENDEHTVPPEDFTITMVEITIEETGEHR